MGGWREEWETEWYRQDLTGQETDFIRVRMRTERGNLVRFTAQYEAVFDDRVYGVVRYDTAHEEPHRDTLDWRGRVVFKLPLPGLPYDAALDVATEDIWANWQRYRDEFEGRLP